MGWDWETRKMEGLHALLLFIFFKKKGEFPLFSEMGNFLWPKGDKSVITFNSSLWGLSCIFWEVQQLL